MNTVTRRTFLRSYSWIGKLKPKRDQNLEAIAIRQRKSLAWPELKRVNLTNQAKA